jgi:hypothetical protein
MILPIHGRLRFMIGTNCRPENAQCTSTLGKFIPDESDEMRQGDHFLVKFHQTDTGIIVTYLI